MSATDTDELRRMLDEHGVEHADFESAPYPPYNSTRRMTTFWANKCVWQYIEDEREGGDVELVGRYMSTSVTPEQAIEATLGRGTCHNVHEPPKGTTFWPSPHFKCSECGATHVSMEYVFYCPNCGRRIVEVDE